MRTVAEPFTASEVRVEPRETPGITVNGTPADVDHVQKADIRVDLVDGDRRSYVVEHVLGPLGLRGVTAADVVGIREDWQFARVEDRICYSRGVGPQGVVGHPAGYPNPAIADGIADVGVVTRGEPVRHTVAEPVTVTAGDGSLTLRPRDRGTGMRFELRFRGEELTVEVDPAGETDDDLVDRVTGSQTPYLTEDPREGITHSIADLVSDIAVIGGLEDVVVEAELTGAEGYHRLTVGAPRRAHAEGLVVEH
ncbi:MAG: hypothetical protein ABEJ57_03370 [Halobacteriaceae archaeon]